MWFAVGAAVGLCAWRLGASPVSAWGLKLATGFGAMLVLPLMAAIVLAIMARMVDGRAGALAYGDFFNILPWLLAKVQRAASAFFGVVTVAAVCWTVVGSTNALAVVLLGTLFGSAFAYCWAGMVFITRDVHLTRTSR